MLLQSVSVSGVLSDVIPVYPLLGKQHMHYCTGQSAVSARAQHQVQIRLLCCTSSVGVYDYQPCIIVSASFGDVVHNIDLRVHRISAPDYHQIRLTHQANITAPLGSRTGNPTGIGECRAERRMLPRCTVRMTEAIKAVALHQPHGAGVVKRPNGLWPRHLSNTVKSLSDQINGVGQGHRFKGCQ